MNEESPPLGLFFMLFFVLFLIFIDTPEKSDDKKSSSPKKEEVKFQDRISTNTLEMKEFKRTEENGLQFIKQIHIQ